MTFAMYKANAEDPELAAFDASRRSICYSTGVAYNRHKVGLNVAIQKKTHSYWVHKVRNIMLIKAEQNWNYKKMSRDVMWFAELQDVLAPDNYGGRKHH